MPLILRRSAEFRFIIQKKNGDKNKFYPKVASASVAYGYPFQASTASIKLVPHSGDTSEYHTGMDEDDIVRLQVNQKFYVGELNDWITLFEGRINDINPSYGSNDEVSFRCVGHEEALFHYYVEDDKDWSSVTTGYIIQSLINSYGVRITDAATSLIDVDNSTVITSYTIKANSKTIGDVIKDLETLEGNGYRFRVHNTYDSDDNLEATYAVWEAVNTTPVTHTMAFEGSVRFKSANMKSTKSTILNKVIVYGDSSTVQFTGTYEDTDSQDSYDYRMNVFTDKSIGSNAMCTAIATAIVNKFKDPMINGTINLMGSIFLRVADYIHCRIQSIELGGDYIDDNFIVKKINHNISPSDFSTNITVGDGEMTPADIIASFVYANRMNNANAID